VFLPTSLRANQRGSRQLFRRWIRRFRRHRAEAPPSAPPTLYSPGAMDDYAVAPTTRLPKPLSRTEWPYSVPTQGLSRSMPPHQRRAGANRQSARATCRVARRRQPQPIKAFEPSSASLSCALLLDTTGSMQASPARPQDAALRLLGELREEDSAAVYSFSEVTRWSAQAFTKNKRAAKRAVLPAYPHGKTASMMPSLKWLTRSPAQRQEGHRRLHRWRRQIRVPLPSEQPSARAKLPVCLFTPSRRGARSIIPPS